MGSLAILVSLAYAENWRRHGAPLRYAHGCAPQRWSHTAESCISCGATAQQLSNLPREIHTLRMFLRRWGTSPEGRVVWVYERRLV